MSPCPGGDTQPLSLRPSAQAAGGSLWFGLPVTGIGNSLVSLSVVADALRLDTNASPGRVLSAQLCAFANASCGSLTALQQTGYLRAAVSNAGPLPSDFTVVVRWPGFGGARQQTRCMRAPFVGSVACSMPLWRLHRTRRVCSSDAALGARTCLPHHAALHGVSKDARVPPSVLHVSMRLACNNVVFYRGAAPKQARAHRQPTAARPSCPWPRKRSRWRRAPPAASRLRCI